MKRSCAGCEQDGVESSLGPDIPGNGTTHGLCRYHELVTLEGGELLEPDEARELLVIRAVRFKQPVEAVVKLFRDFGVPFKKAVGIVRRAFLLIAAGFIFSGCAGVNQFLTAWGEQPRLEVDNANGGYIRRGDWK